MKCASCGDLNAPDAAECGNCGAGIVGGGEQSTLTAGPNDSRIPDVTAPEVLWTPRSISYDVQRPPETDAPRAQLDESVYSMAINVRRIFLVMLTILVLCTIGLSAAMYTVVADDPDIGIVKLMIVLAALAAVVGALYAASSKRLSTR